MAKTKEQETQPAKKYEDRKPLLERKISLSKDENWLIIKTIRTDIVHANYMHKILNKGE